MARPASTNFDKEIRSQVAANLISLLRKKGWTKSDLSKETEISPSTLSGYFNEKYNITPGNLQTIAEVFGVEKGDIDPRYKIDEESVTSFLSNYFNKQSESKKNLAKLWWESSIKESEGASPMQPNLYSLQEVDLDDNHRLIFTLPSFFKSPNSLAKRKAIMSKPSSELNPEGQLDKLTLRAEANTASALLTRYIENVNQLLSIREKIKPSEDLQNFLTVIAGTISIAENIKKEYSEILNTTSKDE